MDRTIIKINRLQMTWLTLSNNISVRYPQGSIAEQIHHRPTRVLTCVSINCRPRMTSEIECSAIDGVIEEDYGVLYDAKKR